MDNCKFLLLLIKDKDKKKQVAIDVMDISAITYYNQTHCKVTLKSGKEVMVCKSVENLWKYIEKNVEDD